MRDLYVMLCENETLKLYKIMYVIHYKLTKYIIMLIALWCQSGASTYMCLNCHLFQIFQISKQIPRLKLIFFSPKFHFS